MTSSRRAARALPFLLTLFTLSVVVGNDVAAQETRAESLKRRREEKAKQLEPYRSPVAERALLFIEREGLFAPVLRSGWYPHITSLTSGGGIALGPGYRTPLDRPVVLDLWAAGSPKRYWAFEARVSAPRLADGRYFTEVFARRRAFPSEDFYGPGFSSVLNSRVSYSIRDTTVGGRAGVRVTPLLTTGGGAEFIDPDLGRGADRKFPSIEDLVPDSTGLLTQPDFGRFYGFVDLNYRQPRGFPRAGGRYYVVVDRFGDLDRDAFSFTRLDVDLQQYISILRQRRVLALRALGSFARADAGHRVPFYLQKTLGGSNTLRGYREFRFRDAHLLLLQGEYRWEVASAIEAALFADAGKTAPTFDSLGGVSFKTDWGAGVRFGPASGVFLRIDAAFGSPESPRYYIKFGHVF